MRSVAQEIHISDPASVARRFNSKFRVMENGCWEWIAYRNKKGYGHFVVENRVLQAHRVSLRLSGVEIPPGKMVLHVCNNPPCVRPDHLYIGTAVENAEQCVRDGRLNSWNSKKKCCPKCGGDYSLDSQGFRFCRPCLREWWIANTPRRLESRRLNRERARRTA